MVRAYVERQPGHGQASEVSPGTLFSSGLIAGGSITGILFAVLVGSGTIDPFRAVGDALPFLRTGAFGQVAGGLLFLALALVLGRAAKRKL